MKKVLKMIYCRIGKIICFIDLSIRKIRDYVDPPKADSILFVAHPDDDTLFFYSCIAREKPYVVMLFTGWSIRRLSDFFKAMGYYGVRCRAYGEISDGAYEDPLRRKKTERHIRECLAIGNFDTVYTHNEDGEYGHNTHRLVHEAVTNQCQGMNCNIFCPVEKAEISKYPLSYEMLKAKQEVFETIYRSEAWVMTEEAAGTPVWFKCEQLEKIK